MGWAGAQKDSFGVFKTDFLAKGGSAGQKHITLSLNYRSSARIVEILNTLKRRLAPAEPDFRAARPAPPLPPEKVCAVILSPDAATEAEAPGSFLAAELKSGMSPRNVGLLVRQKAADWEASLAPVLARYGVVLRNEDRDVGGASIQDLMTEPYATTVMDGFELLLRERGGAVWVRVLEAFSDIEGLVSDEEPERIQEIAEKLDAFHAENRIKSPESSVTPVEAGNLLTAVETFFGISYQL
jgi:hypothetical protein